jgi:uncharacterized oxidoreductase
VSEQVTIAADALGGWVARIFAAAGSEEPYAARVAHRLLESNLAGHESHGVIRVPLYLQWQREGRVIANRSGRVISDRGALATIDGEFGYGQVVGELMVEEGAKRAAAHGVATIALRRAGHLGRIGGWAEMAAARGLVSLLFVNSPGRGGIQVAPFGGRERRLPPNPFSIGVPRAEGPPLVLDVTTSVVPEGKVRVALNSGASLPEGAVIDAVGRPSRDPKAFYGPPAGALLPMAGHKGSGLCLMIDLLAGALTGGGRADPNVEGHGNNMLAIFLAPERLGGAQSLAADAADLAAWVKSAAPIEPGVEVLVPGEREATLRVERLARGVPLDAETWRQIASAGTALGVPPPQIVRRSK